MVTCFGWEGVKKNWTIKVLMTMSTARLIQKRQLRRESVIDCGRRGGGRPGGRVDCGCSGGALLATMCTLRPAQLCGGIAAADFRQQRAHARKTQGVGPAAVYWQNRAGSHGSYRPADVGRQRMTAGAQSDQLQAHRSNPRHHDLEAGVVRTQRNPVAVHVDG